LGEATGSEQQQRGKSSHSTTLASRSLADLFPRGGDARNAESGDDATCVNAAVKTVADEGYTIDPLNVVFS